MNYNDLLNTQEWQNKRLEILERDNHTCQRCGLGKNTKMPQGLIIGFNEIDSMKFKFDFFQTLVNNFKQKYVVVSNSDNKNIVCKTNVGEENFFSNITHYLIMTQVGIKSKIVYDLAASTEDFVDKYNKLFSNCNERALEKLYEKIGNEFDVDREGFWLIEREKRYEYTKNKNLHVHHKCYRAGVKIWSQRDDEYITLCNICHKIIHENQKIMFYTKNNDSISLMPCGRCGGTRYIDAYKHISNGICFKCNGAGFENYLY